MQLWFLNYIQMLVDKVTSHKSDLVQQTFYNLYYLEVVLSQTYDIIYYDLRNAAAYAH